MKRQAQVVQVAKLLQPKAPYKLKKHSSIREEAEEKKIAVGREKTNPTPKKKKTNTHSLPTNRTTKKPAITVKQQKRKDYSRSKKTAPFIFYLGTL